MDCSGLGMVIELWFCRHLWNAESVGAPAFRHIRYRCPFLIVHVCLLRCADYNCKFWKHLFFFYFWCCNRINRRNYGLHLPIIIMQSMWEILFVTFRSHHEWKMGEVERALENEFLFFFCGICHVSSEHRSDSSHLSDVNETLVLASERRLFQKWLQSWIYPRTENIKRRMVNNGSTDNGL